MNFKDLLVYRASFFASLFLMFFWTGAYVILIEVIFYHTSSLAGWNKGQVLLILAFYYFVQNLSDVFFKDNFEEFGALMRRGELDFHLMKPAPARFLSFFYRMRFDNFGSFVITGALFFYAFSNLPEPISKVSLLFGFFYAFTSLILYFNILSLIATLAFWVQKNDTLGSLIWNFTQIARFPRQIYGGIPGKIFTFGLPLALIAALPAEIALKFDSGYLPLYFFGITIAFSLLAKFLWNLGLRKYTSAG